MVNIWKKTAIFILSLILFTALSVSSVIAADASDIASDFSDGKKNIICIAHRGDWHSFPENSAEAINAAAQRTTAIILPGVNLNLSATFFFAPTFSES